MQEEISYLLQKIISGGGFTCEATLQARKHLDLVVRAQTALEHPLSLRHAVDLHTRKTEEGGAWAARAERNVLINGTCDHPPVDTEDKTP